MNRSDTPPDLPGIAARDLRFREYRAGDEHQILTLYSLAFPGKKRSLRAWRWRYPENPAGMCVYLGFESTGTLVAHYAGIPVLGQYLGRSCMMAQPVDAMSHPGIRGRTLARSGEFIRVAVEAFSEFSGAGRVEIGFGFPSGRHLDLGAQSLGYVPLYAIPRLALGIREAADRNAIASPAGGQVVTARAFDRAADDLWERLKGEYPTAVARTSRYLNWRYSQHPERRYKVFAWVDVRGEWSAWVVTTIRGGRLLLVDMLLPAAGPEVAVELIRTAIAWGRRRQARWCETWMPPFTPGRELLESFGFSNCIDDSGLVLVARAFVESIDLKTFCDTFYFQMGDWDMY